jgi:release factor glutamine methyltransferase
MAEQFTSKEIENPRLIAEMLLTHVLGGKRIDLYADANRTATDDERATLREFVQRAMKHEPVQYIVGNAWFFGTEFQVNASTMIPRSCTERLVEQVITHCHEKAPSPRIADIGTGSGCIAVTLATHVPDAKITATDISPDALELAKVNASVQNVETQITFLEGDGSTPLLDLDPFDVVCSNPPYIPDDEMSQLAPNVVDWEPTSALSGGKNGLDLISTIISNAPKILKPRGLLIIELASSTRDEALELAITEEDLVDAKIIRDAFGDDRFLRAIVRAY